MKLTIENVQVAIKGMMKYNNTCISEKLLAVVAGNYAKGNNIITLHLQSLYEDENFDSIVGEIKNLYYTEADGRAQLRGDIIFDTELLDIQSLLHSLANGCVYLSPHFMNVGSLNHCFACLSSVTLSKAEDTLFDGIEPLDISGLDGLINALYKEPATETPESAIRFNKKYDNANSGLIGQISHNESQGNTIRVISSFIPAIRKYSNDKRSLALIGRIIAVAGASPNCRQDEIEAVYRKPLDEIIDFFVREWSGVHRQGH
ncbi:hypothetical protein DMA64_18605 [Salmonella enterica subsp. enterica serovar Newport]|nr:hypothetical protein [Salmonella enterica subsp. enterica serovar Newport]ECC3833417.1 hypothetical protein [Salmonella enterica subsp. enterica]EDI0657982.1 hypothetical protein [Salmonella enterica subsp. enterica serovar Newport]